MAVYGVCIDHVWELLLENSSYNVQQGQTPATTYTGTMTSAPILIFFSYLFIRIYVMFIHTTAVHELLDC